MIINSDDAEKALISGYAQLAVGLEVKDSSIEGKGLYSGNPIKQGDILFQIIAEKSHHHYEPSAAPVNPNWIGCGYEEWLMVGPGDLAMYLNHSCSPNVMINENLQLVAIRDIKPDVEIRLDYSTTELDPFWSMECSCQSPDCRKLLRAFQYLPQDLQQRYSAFISPVFVRTAEVLKEHQPVVSASDGRPEK